MATKRGVRRVKSKLSSKLGLLIPIVPAARGGAAARGAAPSKAAAARAKGKKPADVEGRRSGAQRRADSKRSVERRAERGTRGARGQRKGRATPRAAKGGLVMKVEHDVVKADRLVRSAQEKVDKAQAEVKRVVRRTGGGAGIRLKDLIGARPGGLSLKIVK